MIGVRAARETAPVTLEEHVDSVRPNPAVVSTHLVDEAPVRLAELDAG